MNNQLMVQHAVACLEALEHPTTPQHISRSQRIPLEQCEHILEQFTRAGLVKENTVGLLERTRPMEDLTALDVLQALWSVKTQTSFNVLYAYAPRQADDVVRLLVQRDAWAQG